MEYRGEQPDYSVCLFDQFMHANTFRTCISSFQELCEFLDVKPNDFKTCYPYLKNRLTSWKAKTLWSKLDKRAFHKDYKRNKACSNTKVLIIGAGPCGLRSAIEASLLGAKVVVVEKRDRFSRNNVLHLWPFVIEDLRSLGAKKFYGKFCAGSIDHISIRQLQCMLLKVALLFGVEVHGNTAFEGLVEPPEDQEEERIGWRALISPSPHPLSEYEFDALIGADGKRNTLSGFKRKEFRGKLAIAITANFINRHTLAETRVEEISGVAYIFNQKFFQDLKANTRIDLENIVYYKDETHYFVMTAKKQSLLEKGVLLDDYAETELLLSGENISQEALLDYAREAADFSTNRKLPKLDFALNHYGLPDVAMFDFTSMFAAENAARVVERNGCQLLVQLVGDSLLEPFWPTGSGCARGFLGVFDALWAVKSWASGRKSLLEVLSERESLHRLLAQTTPENLHKDIHQYSIDPKTRYPNLNMQAVEPGNCLSLYDTGKDTISDDVLAHRTRPKLERKGSVIRTSKLILWSQKVIEDYMNVSITDMTSSWQSGLALCALIHRFRPELLDFHCLKEDDVAENNQLAFDIAEREFGISPCMTGKEMAATDEPDKLLMVAYLSQFYEIFKEELPLQTDTANVLPEEEFIPGHKSPAQRAALLARLNKKFHKKSPRREHGEEKENVKRRSSSGSKRRSRENSESAKMYAAKFKELMEENQTKYCVDKDELDVGVRGANRVSAMADTLFAQFQEIAGVKQTPRERMNRPSFVFGASQASHINKMAEQLYHQFEEIAGTEVNQEGTNRPSGNTSAVIEKMTQQLREQFSDMAEGKPSASSRQKALEDVQSQEVSKMKALLQDQFNEIAGFKPAGDVEDKPQINISMQSQIQDIAKDLEGQFKDIAGMAPRRRNSQSLEPASPKQTGKIKELAEDLHSKFIAMAAVQQPDIVTDEQKSQGQVKAMADNLFAKFNRVDTYRETASSQSSGSNEHINKMAQQLLQQCQQLVDEKAPTPTTTSPGKKNVSTKAQELQAKFQELSGVKPTIREPPKNVPASAKKKIDTGALSRWQVQDMATKIVNKFQDVQSSKKTTTKLIASEGPTTEVKVMTYQLLAKVEEMAAKSKQSDPKQISQISQGQLKETTERFMADLKERQRQPDKRQVTTGVSSIYDMLMARFQPVEDGDETKEEEPEPLTALNISDRILFSKFRDMAGLKSTRGEEQPRQKQRTSWWGSQQPKSKQYSGAIGGSDMCFFCGKRVYVMERLSAEGLFFHRGCFKCNHCQTTLRIGNYAFYMPPNENRLDGRFYCRPHFKYSKMPDGGPRKRRIEEAIKEPDSRLAEIPAEPPMVPPVQPLTLFRDEPEEKKYKSSPRITERDSMSTPERIILDNSLDRSVGMLLSEEELASYNYGDSTMEFDSDESTSSEEEEESEDEYSDLEEVEIPKKWIRSKHFDGDVFESDDDDDDDDDDDVSWDESDDDDEEAGAIVDGDENYDSDLTSEEELMPVENVSKELVWQSPKAKQKELDDEQSQLEVQKTGEREDIKEVLQVVEPEPVSSPKPELKDLEVLPKEEVNKPVDEATTPSEEPVGDRYDHKAQVANITSLKLQWLIQPEAPDPSMWGRRRISKPTSPSPKTLSPEEDNPPPVPPFPSQEDLVKANIIQDDDAETKEDGVTGDAVKEEDGKDEIEDAVVYKEDAKEAEDGEVDKETLKEEGEIEVLEIKTDSDTDSEGEILVEVATIGTKSTLVEDERSDGEDESEESEGEFLVEVDTVNTFTATEDSTDGALNIKEKTSDKVLQGQDVVDGNGSLEIYEAEYAVLEWKEAVAKATGDEVDGGQIEKGSGSQDSYDENLAEVYGRTLTRLEGEGDSDDEERLDKEFEQLGHFDSPKELDTESASDDDKVEQVEEPVPQPEEPADKPDSPEESLADVYGDTMARIEAVIETPVEDKKIEDVFTFDYIDHDAESELTDDDEIFEKDDQSSKAHYARKNLLTQEEMLSGSADKDEEPGEVPGVAEFHPDVASDRDVPPVRTKSPPVPIAMGEDFSSSEQEDDDDSVPMSKDEVNAEVEVDEEKPIPMEEDKVSQSEEEKDLQIEDRMNSEREEEKNVRIDEEENSQVAEEISQVEKQNSETEEEKKSEIEEQKNLESEGEKNLEIEGEKNLEIEGEKNLEIEGEKNLESEGEKNLESEDVKNSQMEEEQDVKIDENIPKASEEPKQSRKKKQVQAEETIVADQDIGIVLHDPKVIVHVQEACYLADTPQKTPELNLDTTNVTRRSKHSLSKVPKFDALELETAGRASSPQSSEPSSADSTLNKDTLLSLQEQLMNISKLENSTSLPGEEKGGVVSPILSSPDADISDRSLNDVDLSFKSTNDSLPVVNDISKDSSNMSYATPNASIEYDADFLEELDKVNRTASKTTTMSTDRSSRPESAFSVGSVDSLNDDLHISIMSSDSESGDSAKATLEMYAKELEYQSFRDEGEDALPTSPREEVKSLPGKVNEEQKGVKILPEKEVKKEEKKQKEVEPKEELEIKPPPRKKHQKQKQKQAVSKSKFYATFDESFDDIPSVDDVEDQVPKGKEGVVKATPEKVKSKANEQKKVKGRAKKYVASDDSFMDEVYHTPMTSVKVDKRKVKGNDMVSEKGKLDSRKAIAESASPKLTSKPLPAPVLKDKKDSKSGAEKDKKTKALSKTNVTKKEEKGAKASPRLKVTPKSSREPSPSVIVTPGETGAEFNKSQKQKKQSKAKASESKSPEQKPKKTPKERKAKTPLSKLKAEIKKIDLDGKNKNQGKGKMDASTLNESTKSKKSSQKKGEEIPMDEIKSTKKTKPEKKIPDRAPLARLEDTDDTLSEGDTKTPDPAVRPKTTSGFTPRPLPPRPATYSSSSTAGIVGDEMQSSDSSEGEELFPITPTSPESMDKKKKSKRKSLTRKLKVFKSRKSQDKSSKYTEDELNEKLTKKVQKAARKLHKQQVQKRLRMAQEIQRHLQEVEVKQKSLEERGVELEKSLRVDSSDSFCDQLVKIYMITGDEKDEEGMMMQEWLTLINEKNKLVRFEQELTIQAKELELEDRHSRLQQELRERMAIDDSKKTKEMVEDEKKLLEEMLEVVEQRDKLVSLLEEERLKERELDKDIETVMLQKGLDVTSVQR
ncbi:uncharacterized protein LOC144453173 [Glandiceps talaboti]